MSRPTRWPSRSSVRGACSTSAAGSATASICSPRGRRSASTSTRRRWPARTARRWWRTCAPCRSRARSFDSVLSVQSIEHVPDPERVLAEVARVLRPDGVAVFVTPNRLTLGRPDEIIDPYHHVEFDAAELRALCAPWFGGVTVRGLFGSPRYMALFDAERRTLDRLLAARRAAAAAGGAEPRAAAALRPAAAAGAATRTIRGRRRSSRRTSSCATTGSKRRWTSSPSARTRSRGDARLRLVRGPARRVRRPLARPRPLRGLRRRDDRSVARPATSWRAPTGTGTGRPAGRRFSVVGDALLRRTRGHLAGRLDAIAPPGAVLDVGAGDGTLIDALARQGREAVGLEREAGRPDVRDEPLGDDRRRMGGGRVLALARASAGPRGRRAPRRAAAGARRRARRRRARRGQPPGADLRRPLAAPRPAAPSRAPDVARAAATGSRAPGCGSSASRAPAAGRS